MYLQKKRPVVPYSAESDGFAPGIANKESVQKMTYDNDEATFESKQVDFLLPLATRFFDMRIRGHNSCAWNEEFIINELASHLLSPSTIILFEILEMNPSMIMKKDKRLNFENLYPIAWAYLRPLGTAHIHMTRSRLQLY